GTARGRRARGAARGPAPRGGVHARGRELGGRRADPAIPGGMMRNGMLRTAAVVPQLALASCATMETQAQEVNVLQVVGQRFAHQPLSMMLSRYGAPARQMNVEGVT